MAETPELIALANAAADAAGIPQTLFLGLIKTESDWNPAARSGAGALGLAQVMPIWTSPRYAAEIGMTGYTPADLLRPEINVQFGSKILAAELRRFGMPELAAMAYNAGAGTVNAAIQRAGTTDPAAVSVQLPKAETRAYWKKVLTWTDAYAQKISEIQASVETVATDVSETVKDAASGNAPLLVLGGLLALGWLAVRR